MIDFFISYIKVIIADYGAFGVFIATLIEEVVTPVPSPVVPLAAGFFLIEPTAEIFPALVQIFFTIALPVAFGLTIGSIVVYFIGFWGGKPIIDRYKKWLGFSWDDLEKTEQHFTKGKRDEVVLFGLRLVPIIPGVAISGLCGIIRYPVFKFVIITFVGALIRAFILGFIGSRVGEVYVDYADTISRWEDYILVGVIIIFGFLLGWYFYRRGSK